MAGGSLARSLGLGIGVLLAGHGAGARAEDAPDASGDIVVTARLRAETIESVPIPVTALSGDALAEKNQNNLQDLAQSVPSLDFRDGASNKDRTVFIRGVGTITTSPGVEPSVSTVVDGVVLSRPGQATLDLVDIDRVEILRGPQGTLFGKNASAGVINIVSKTPTDTLHGDLETSYFGGDEKRLRASVSGALIPDRLLFSVTGLVADYDGNVHSLTSGHDVNGYNHKGGRLKLVAKPSSTVTLTLTGDYMRSRDTTPIGVFVSSGVRAYPTGIVTPNPTLANILSSEGIVPGSDNRTVAPTFDSDVRDKNYGGAFQADIEIGNSLLTSITAYREWRNVQHQDWDGVDRFTAGGPSALPQGVDLGQVFSHQLSQELRFTSAKGHLLDYVLGLYFMHEKDDEIYRRDEDLPAGLGSYYGLAHYGITSNNFAAYGEGNLNFTSSLRAIIGGRLILDDLDFYHNRVSNVPAGGVPGISTDIANTGNISHTDYSGRVGLQYDLGRHANIYATFSRGYKGPAYNVFFNMVASSITPLKPETSNDYEAGIKGDVLGGALRGNLALFLTKFDNYQTNYLDTFQGAFVTRLTNAGQVSTRGVEVDLTARPTRRLQLGFDGAYTNAHIDHFDCPAGATCPDYDGQPLPFAPKWKFHVEGTYSIPLTDGLKLELNSDYNYRSATQYQITETPDTIQPAYGIWNASIALLGDGSRHWQLRGIVKNITNKSYSSYLAYGSVAGAIRFVPRDDSRYFGVLANIGF